MVNIFPAFDSVSGAPLWGKLSTWLSSTFATKAEMSEVATGDPVSITDVTMAAALDAGGATSDRVDSRAAAAAVTAVDESATLRAVVQARSASTTSAVMAPIARAADLDAQTVVRHTFPGADSTTTVGLPDVGVAPVATPNPWGVTNNEAHPTSAVGTQFLTWDVGVDQEVDVVVIPSALDNASGVALRFVDSQNYIAVGLKPGGDVIWVIRRIGGAQTVPISSPEAVVIDPGVRYRLRVDLRGGYVRVWLDDAILLRWRVDAAALTALSGATRAGLFTTSDNAVRFDDLTIRNLGESITSHSPEVWGSANTASLTIPTHDGSGQAVHPDVIDFGEGNTWNGYRYWMAHTPYPNSNEAFEIPNIIASHDGTTWEVPPGLTNPVSSGYDPDIVMDGARMHLISQGMKHSYSDDGITWSQFTWLFVQEVGEVSPSVMKDGDIWRMWSIQKLTGEPYKLLHRTAPAVTGPWSEPVALWMDPEPGRDIWHIDVVKDGGVYYALVVEGMAGTSGGAGVLHLATSQDGYGWRVSSRQLISLGQPYYDSDTNIIYRASLVPVDADTFDVWYSAMSGAGEWSIRRTTMNRSPA